MSSEVVGRVYAIRRADDFTFRYVGQTRFVLGKRLQKHFAVARSGRLTPFYSWLRKHMHEDIAIDEFEVVGTNREDLGVAEQFWIGMLKSNGQPLLNLSSGGFGPSQLHWSPEQREAARQRSLGRPGTPRFAGENPFFGKRHSEEQRAAWSATRKGTNTGADNPNFGKFGAQHPAFGAVRSEETRRRLSEQKRGALNPNYGKRLSAETRAKMSGSHQARLAHARIHELAGVWNSTCKYCLKTPPPDGFTIVRTHDQ